MHAETARQALDAGASIINDISGVEFDPAMPALVAERGVPYILTHRRGSATTMTSLAEYHDVVAEVTGELAELRDRFVAAGVAAERIILDPGLGFAKTDEHNWSPPAPPRCLHLTGPPRPGRGLAQAVPRYPAHLGGQGRDAGRA